MSEPTQPRPPSIGQLDAAERAFAERAGLVGEDHAFIRAAFYRELNGWRPSDPLEKP